MEHDDSQVLSRPSSSAVTVLHFKYRFLAEEWDVVLEVAEVVVTETYAVEEAEHMRMRVIRCHQQLT